MLVERRNQGNDDTAENGRIADGGRDQAGPQHADAAEEIAAAEKTTYPEETTMSAASLPAASPAAPSPADAAGVLPQPWPVAPGSAEPVPSSPVPAYHVHDLAYRGILSVKAVFLDFLRSFVPADWVRDLDEDSFTQVESTLVLQDLRKREPDVVWRGRLRAEGPLLDWVSVLLGSRLPAEEGPVLLGKLKEVRSGEEAEEMATNFERMLDRWLEKTKRESRLEERRETARRLMAEGMDDGFIARVTGLSFNEIAQLRQEEQTRQK